MEQLKERTYAIEEQFLSPFACKSAGEHERQRPEKPCEMRTDFQRDRDRIIYCNSFRRLKNKTQVFFSPEGDHYITRLTHTLDVAQIARSLARCLALNEDLAEAIALGHDLGHTPFGHSGERILSTLTGGNFRHNVQSRRVVEVLEKDGEGLNLTYEVRDGIENHKKDGHPKTLEARCVSQADRIAYINHDIEDAVRAGVLCKEDIPREIVEVLGDGSGKRINTAISSIYSYSHGKDMVEMDPVVDKASEDLRNFMFKNVYLTGTVRAEEEKAERMLTEMYGYYISHFEVVPEEYKKHMKTEGCSEQTVVVDYISSMTDRYAICEFNKIFVPHGWLFLDEKHKR
ncbi:MAG: deoxyguanosinetriphosphate triphosphohydrolase [Clostridia bacterium]|nr:deoxyguanosinetriphosphate triphosphohydrolase [Clostridia bacterium]